jgi:hypothetical protein
MDLLLQMIHGYFIAVIDLMGVIKSYESCGSLGHCLSLFRACFCLHQREVLTVQKLRPGVQ